MTDARRLNATSVFVAVMIATLTCFETLAVPLLPDHWPMPWLLALAVAQGVVFLGVHRAPLLVALLAMSIDVVRGEAGALQGSLGATLTQLAAFYGIALYARHRLLSITAGVVALVAINEWKIGDLQLHPLQVGQTRLAILYHLLTVGIALSGAALGTVLRDRRAELNALRERVDDLDAALPDREVRAAEAEQRRVSAAITRLVVDWQRRVREALDDSSRTLRDDPPRAAALLEQTGDGARSVLARMRELLERLRPATDPDAASREQQPAAPAGVDGLIALLEESGVEVSSPRDGRADAAEPARVLIAAATRVAATASELLGGPARRARLTTRADGFELVLAGGPLRFGRREAPSASALAAEQRVRLLGGALRIQRWAGQLTLTLSPRAPEPEPHTRRAFDLAPLRRHGFVFALAAFGVAEQLLIVGIGPPQWERLLFAVAVPLPLLLRDRLPLLAVAGSAALIVLATKHGTYAGVAGQGWVTSFAAAFIAGASRLRLPAAVLGAAIAIGGELWGLYLEPVTWFWDLYVTVSIVALTCWAVGRMVRGDLAAAAAVRTEIRALDVRRAELEKRAAAAERARLAREIHDVVGHAVLLVCVQCGAAQTLATRDPRAAAEAIAAAREAAHSALTELDRLARVLPPRDGERGLGDGLGGLTKLVDDMRGSGVRAELRIAAADEVDPVLAAVLYRIVQESLTNAGKHAPGTDVTVDVLARDGIVDLRVSNPCALAAGHGTTGHGLRNMRERTEQHGGRFAAGPEGGEWVVRATWDTRPATFAPPTTRPSTDAAGQTHP